MANRKTTPEKERRRIVFRFSLPALFFWSFGLLVVLSWSFILGVFVGRGVLPDGIEAIARLRGKIQGIKKDGEASSQSVPGLSTTEEAPQFAFFERLAKETENASTRMDQPDPKKTPKVGPSNHPSVTDPSHTGFTVQLSAADSEEGAARMVNRLKKKGYPAYFVKAHVKGKLYFRVRCGKFETEARAKAYAAEIARRLGIQGMVSRVEG
jgi:cell division septation protein DedD